MAATELAQAVERGLVTVSAVPGGYEIAGAVRDLLIMAELENMGAVWRDRKEVYFIAAGSDADGVDRSLDRLRLKTAAVAAALAARGAKARRDGLAEYDRQRARLMRSMTRDLKEIYKQALQEHRQALDATIKAIAAAADPVEAIKLAHRRNELASVIDELEAGLSKAGINAERYVSGRLVEAAAISRRVAAWQIDNMSGVEVSRMIGHNFATIAATARTSYHGKYDLKAWQGVADRAQARKTIKLAITRGVLTGEHPSKIAHRIEGLFTGDEPLSPYKRSVRIAQTEAHRVLAQAAEELMQDAADAGAREFKRWDATLDSKTRESHRDLDGQLRRPGESFAPGIYKPGDGGPAESINCRCALVPVHDGFGPEFPVRRDNDARKSIPYMTYREWEAWKGDST